jgi:hypothetical protein
VRAAPCTRAPVPCARAVRPCRAPVPCVQLHCTCVVIFTTVAFFARSAARRVAASCGIRVGGDPRPIAPARAQHSACLRLPRLVCAVRLLLVPCGKGAVALVFAIVRPSRASSCVIVQTARAG